MKIKLLGKYTNGNYNVKIFDDGTKIRENDLDFLSASFPENIDLKITDYCDAGCAFCHENSTIKGIHANILNSEFINSIHPFTELALGGGNPISHPDLIPFLEILKSKNIIANITVNQKHFIEKQDFISHLVSENLIYGLGVSVTSVHDDLIQLLKKYKNIVVHVIYGVITENELKKLYNHNLKLLILGYKNFRRGEKWLLKKSKEFETNSNWMYLELPEMLDKFSVISFDNLGIGQLDVKRLMSKKEWNKFYMGDDGQFTMYIDMVKNTFSKTSTSIIRYDVLDNIEEMFKIIKNSP